MVALSRSAYATPVWIVDLDGEPINIRAIIQNALELSGSATGADLDTNGEPVPSYKAQSYTYDTSGNLKTVTVEDGSDSWVRTYTWDNGVQVADSGWVKQ